MLPIHTKRSSTFFRAVVACLAELVHRMNGQVMVYLSLVCLSELLISASTAISVPTAEDPALLGHHLSFHGRRGAATAAAAVWTAAAAAAVSAAAGFCGRRVSGGESPTHYYRCRQYRDAPQTSPCAASHLMFSIGNQLPTARCPGRGGRGAVSTATAAGARSHYRLDAAPDNHLTNDDRR